MDYAKALFALKVRETAGQRLAAHMPDDVLEEDEMAYFLENYESAVEGVLNEIDWTMRIIDKQSA